LCAKPPCSGKKAGSHAKGGMDDARTAKWKEKFEIQKKLLAGFQVRVIFDIGAYVGGFSRSYRKNFPSAQIYAFEPFQDSYEVGVERVKGDTGVHFFKKAVTGKTGRISLYCNQDVLTSSTIPSAETGTYVDKLTKTVDCVEVDSVSIDDFCQEKNIHQIDILKLDIQGAELAALEGAASLLDQQRIRLMFIEVEFIEIYKGQPLFYDVAGYLTGKGYSLYDFRGLSYTEKGQLAWGDAIFCSQEVMESLEPVLSQKDGGI